MTTTIPHTFATQQAGQVPASYLDDNFTALAAGSYPPSPVPDLQTWLQAAVDGDPASGFGESANWIWGNLALDTPVVITMANHMSGFVFDAHGATFTTSPAWTASGQDMITFKTPDTGSIEAQIVGLRVQNLHLQGHNGTSRIARRGLVLSATPGIYGAIFGSSLVNVLVDNCYSDGIYFTGNVFEMSLYGVTCTDCGVTNLGGTGSGAGFTVNNPSTGGIISSIQVYGGDFRTCYYGINSTSDVAFQMTGGINIFATDFIINYSAGVRCPRGLNGIYASHFENNCAGNLVLGSPETLGAIWSDFGNGVNIDNCNAVASVTNQTYLVDLGQSGGSYSFVRNNSYSTLSSAYSPVIKGSTGTLFISDEMTLTDVSGGTMNVIGGRHQVTAQSVTTTTSATYTLLTTDTHLIANRAGTVTLTLPSAATYANRRFTVKTIQAQTVVSASSNVVPLAGGSAGTAILAATAGKYAVLCSDATNWIIMEAN